MTFEFPPFVNEIFEKFSKSGFEIFLVGGAVRDIIMDKNVVDWDFTTNATPEQILEIFPGGFYDNQFGTVGIAHESSIKPYEITTYRQEWEYSDSRRPDKVKWGKILESDLSRRDFTINAIALDKDGKTVDPYNGQEDINKKLIKAVGDPVERFREDALRMMRAVRIAAQIGFEIDNDTFEAIKQNAESINLIAKERVKNELLKLLGSPFPYE